MATLCGSVSRMVESGAIVGGANRLTLGLTCKLRGLRERGRSRVQIEGGITPISVRTPVGQAVMMMAMVRPCGISAGRERTESDDSLTTMYCCIRANGAVPVLNCTGDGPKRMRYPCQRMLPMTVAINAARGDNGRCGVPTWCGMT